MQFRRPIISSAFRLVPGSCLAERLAARVRFASGGAPLKHFDITAEKSAALQLAYQAARDLWRTAHLEKWQLEQPEGEEKPAFARASVSLLLFEFPMKAKSGR